MTFHYIQGMMPTSNTMFNSKRQDVLSNTFQGVSHCRIVDNFIKQAVQGTLESKKHITLSEDYELITTQTRRYTYSYDILVIDKHTNDIVILLQYGKIFLFDCPDDIWLLFQAILEATVEISSFTYTVLSKEYVEEQRFSLSKLHNSDIAGYIVQTLVNDGVLKLAG